MELFIAFANLAKLPRNLHGWFSDQIRSIPTTNAELHQPHEHVCSDRREERPTAHPPAGHLNDACAVSLASHIPERELDQPTSSMRRLCPSESGSIPLYDHDEATRIHLSSHLPREATAIQLGGRSIRASSNKPSMLHEPITTDHLRYLQVGKQRS